MSRKSLSSGRETRVPAKLEPQADRGSGYAWIEAPLEAMVSLQDRGEEAGKVDCAEFDGSIRELELGYAAAPSSR